MGTIVERKRTDGSTAYMAKISLNREGRIVRRESKAMRDAHSVLRDLGMTSSSCWTKH